MNFIYLGIFILTTLVHLYATYSNNRPFRNVTKGFIILSLLGFYHTSVAEPSWFIIIAILLSWLGDLFLIPKGKKWFVLGGSSFLLSHIFFVLGYNELFDITQVPIYFIIPIALAYIFAVVIIFIKLKVYLPKALIIPMFCYLLINGTMNSFAWFRMIEGFGINTLMTVIGSILFFISDTALFFVDFNKDSIMKSHFLVMLTYSLGEFLIILGLIL